VTDLATPTLPSVNNNNNKPTWDSPVTENITKMSLFRRSGKENKVVGDDKGGRPPLKMTIKNAISGAKRTRSQTELSSANTSISSSETCEEQMVPISAVANIVNTTVKQLLPSIVETLKESMESFLDERFKQVDTRVQRLEDTVDRDQALSLMQHDRQEQYSRRENIRIQGILEEEGETEDSLIQTVFAIADAIGTTVEAPISAIHRLGRKGERPRAVMVRFSSRRDKAKTMGAKKKLNNNAEVKKNRKLSENVRIYEDLTDARRAILKIVQDHPNTDFAYTRDGAIIAKDKAGKFVKIEDADDLFHLGFDNVNYRGLYTKRYNSQT